MSQLSKVALAQPNSLEPSYNQAPSETPTPEPTESPQNSTSPSTTPAPNLSKSDSMPMAEAAPDFPLAAPATLPVAATPENLTALLQSDGVRLHWSVPSPRDENGFKIERAQGNGWVELERITNSGGLRDYIDPNNNPRSDLRRDPSRYAKYRVRSFVAGLINSPYSNIATIGATRYDSYPPIAAGNISYSEGGTIHNGTLTFEGGETVRLMVNNPSDYDDFYDAGVKVVPHRDEDRDNLFFDWKGNNFSGPHYNDSNGTIWTAPNVSTPQTFTLTVEINDTKKNSAGQVIGGWPAGHPRNDNPITRSLPVKVVPRVTITFDKTVVKSGISYMNRDVRGTIKARISPSAGAPFISFASNNTSRATVAELGRATRNGVTTVTLKIKGESPTPSGSAEGDAQVEAKRWSTLLKTAKIKVVIPRYVDFSVGSPLYKNFTFPSAPNTIRLGSYARLIVQYNIKDQFHDLLDSVYNGAGVVEEKFVDVHGFNFFNNDWVEVNVPDTTLANGIKRDESSVRLLYSNATFPSRVGAAWTANNLTVTIGGKVMKNIIRVSLAGDLSGNARQQLRVHGFWVLQPDSRRNKIVKDADNPPLPLVVTQVAE